MLEKKAKPLKKHLLTVLFSPYGEEEEVGDELAKLTSILKSRDFPSSQCWKFKIRCCIGLAAVRVLGGNEASWAQKESHDEPECRETGSKTLLLKAHSQ